MIALTADVKDTRTAAPIQGLMLKIRLILNSLLDFMRWEQFDGGPRRQQRMRKGTNLTAITADVKGIRLTDPVQDSILKIRFIPNSLLDFSDHNG